MIIKLKYKDVKSKRSNITNSYSNYLYGTTVSGFSCSLASSTYQVQVQVHPQIIYRIETENKEKKK